MSRGLGKRARAILETLDRTPNGCGSRAAVDRSQAPAFVCYQARETGNVGGVSRYLGHSDVAITPRVYDHNSLSPADVLGPEAVAGGNRKTGAA